MAGIEIEEEEYVSQLTAPVLKRILRLLAPHRRWVIGFLVAISGTATIDALYTYINKIMIDQGIVTRDIPLLIRLAAVYAVFQVLQAGTVFTFFYLSTILGERVQYDLRKSMFNHLQELPLAYYSQNSVGRLIARVTSDSMRVADLMTWGLVDTTWAAVNIFTSTTFMLLINWRLALIVFAAIPVLLLIAVQFRTRILTQFRHARKANSKITGAYNENIAGVRVVKALGREDRNLEEFERVTGDMYRSSYRAAWLSALFLPTVQIVSALALGLIVYFGGMQYHLGLFTVGAIQAFVQYLTLMIWPIQDLARVYAEMQHSIASAERIFKLTDTDPEIQDRTGAVEATSIQGEIEFEHVDFHYAAGQPVLEDFSLKVRPGELIALVGPTGGGKTTIVNLVCRFYEPTRGVIRIDGRDYTGYTIHSIQSRIGVVLQTPHLFSGSIRENIRYGRLDATDEEIEQAAMVAGAHQFIQAFPKRYDEEVGEGGGLLSVGQKQLVSLARAVLARPEIFIMDEATSSVDTLTEVLIQRGMEALMRGCTSFVIAHRLSTIRRADRILVIVDGRIAEMGTHESLYQLKGQYYRLYTQQFRLERERQLEAIAPQPLPFIPES